MPRTANRAAFSLILIPAEQRRRPCACCNHFDPGSRALSDEALKLAAAFASGVTGDILQNALNAASDCERSAVTFQEFDLALQIDEDMVPVNVVEFAQSAPVLQKIDLSAASTTVSDAVAAQLAQELARFSLIGPVVLPQGAQSKWWAQVAQQNA